MFKVTAVDGETGNTILKLEGRLADRWVGELSDLVSAYESGPALTLDLDGLSFVDAPGVALLRDVNRRGITLTGGSAFITTLLG